MFKNNRAHQGQDPDEECLLNPPAYDQGEGSGYTHDGHDYNNDSVDPDYNPPVYNENYDPEAQEDQSLFKGGLVKDQDEAIHRGFLKKVFGILSLQLLVTVGIIAAFTLIESVSNFVAMNLWVLWVTLAVSISCIIILSCCGSVRRKAPWNFIILVIFTLAEGVLVGIICSTYDIQQVLIAFGICCVVVVSLIVFAFQTKYSFLGWGPFLWVAFWILFLVSVILPSFYFGGVMDPNTFRLTDMVVSILFIFLFSFFIVYDVQLLLKGRHQIYTEEYVFVALILYLDIINLFVRILSLFRK